MIWWTPIGSPTKQYERIPSTNSWTTPYKYSTSHNMFLTKRISHQWRNCRLLFVRIVPGSLLLHVCQVFLHSFGVSGCDSLSQNTFLKAGNSYIQGYLALILKVVAHSIIKTTPLFINHFGWKLTMKTVQLALFLKYNLLRLSISTLSKSFLRLLINFWFTLLLFRRFGKFSVLKLLFNWQ